MSRQEGQEVVVDTTRAFHEAGDKFTRTKNVGISIDAKQRKKIVSGDKIEKMARSMVSSRVPQDSEGRILSGLTIFDGI